jgi:hypothetical protein
MQVKESQGGRDPGGGRDQGELSFTLVEAAIPAPATILSLSSQCLTYYCDGAI